MKTFRIIDERDNSPVLGSVDAPLENVHVQNCGPLPGEKMLKDLAVGERSRCRWILGDRGKIYAVWRIS